MKPSMFDPEFFPTPSHIAGRMLAKISKDAERYLEPSAGWGVLSECCRMRGHDRWDSRKNDVDCIERDPELVSILLQKEFPVVGFDWLEYDGVSAYDAIVMNPPFSNGDAHLMKAWEFLHSGEIVCLLNEQTILNPHTQLRRKLVEIIAEHGEVEYLGECFKDARRPTDVRVAMVYLKKESEDDRIELWSTDAPEKKIDGDLGTAEDAMLAIRDTLGNKEHYYNAALEHALKGFAHIRKAAVFMAANEIDLGCGDKDYKHIVALALRNLTEARAEFSRKHRRDAWMSVLDRMEFRTYLDKKQRDALLRDVEKNTNLPFNAENIKNTLTNIFEQRTRLFEQSVANVFDELTRHFKGNTVSEGWKTNDNFRVNRKLIFPWGCRFDGKYCKDFSLYGRGDIDIYWDLDRVLCVLGGRKLDEITTVGAALEHAFRRLGHNVKSPFNNYCISTHFEIRFYMKGTVHITFRDEKLWEAFNRAAAKGKKWLGSNTNGRDEWPGRRTRAERRRERQYGPGRYKDEEQRRGAIRVELLDRLDALRRSKGITEPEPDVSDEQDDVLQTAIQSTAECTALAVIPLKSGPVINGAGSRLARALASDPVEKPEVRKEKSNKTKTVDPARSEACKRAWITIRANRAKAAQKGAA